ncbi:ALQxL family class IV lanthipeptide [Kitasatospora azatica]|nr:ALQxL family class IV lanthipeptide [Kitasatospora azatica]
MELDLDTLQQLPTTEAQAYAGGGLDPDCKFTCGSSCEYTCLHTGCDQTT